MQELFQRKTVGQRMNDLIRLYNRRGKRHNIELTYNKLILKYSTDFKLRFNALLAQIKEIEERALDMNPIERLIYYLREEINVYKHYENTISSIDKILFDTLIIDLYRNLINSTITTIRHITRIAHYESIYYHNKPLLLENTELITISPFIMSFEEWKTLFITDIENTYLSGTDAKSVADMVYHCLLDGLKRTKRKYFNNYYDKPMRGYLGTKITTWEINRWIYSYKGGNIYGLINDEDLSIKKISNEINDFRTSQSITININPKYKQSDILKLFKSLPKHWIPDINTENFIHYKTTYKRPRGNDYYIKTLDSKLFKKVELEEEDKPELENFISFIGFLKKEKILLDGQLHIAKVIMSCLKNPIWGDSNIKRKLNTPLPNSIRKELIYQLPK